MERQFAMLNKWLEKNPDVVLTDDQYNSLESLIYEYSEMWAGSNIC